MKTDMIHTSGADACVNPQSIQSRPSVKPQILLADDDAEMRALLTLVLQNDGYEVVECVDGARLIEYLTTLCTPDASLHIDLMICDMRMPGATGLDVLEQMGSRPGFPSMILITAFGDDQLHRRAQELGAYASLDKPFEVDQLLQLVRGLLSNPPPPGRDESP